MSTAELRPLQAKQESLTEITFEAIRDAIVSKTLPPGSRVSEATLAARLEVSKTPVREALLRLRLIGLVEPTSRGLRVIEPDSGLIRDAYEFRAGLERTAAWHAAVRREAAEGEAVLQAAHASLDSARAGDPAAFRAWDRRFHTLVASTCGNSILESAILDSLVLTSALRSRDLPPTGDSVVCGGEHVRIAEAVRSGAPEEAARHMDAHVQHVMSIVLSAAARQHPVTAG